MARGKKFTRMGGIEYKGQSHVDGGGVTINIYDKNSIGMILRCAGTTKPTDGTAGYAKGCQFIDTDVAAGSQGFYLNIGDTTACNFDAIAANSTSSSSSSSSTISTSSSSISSSSSSVSTSSSSVSTSSSSSSVTL